METELYYREKVHEVYPEAIFVVRNGMFFAVYDKDPRTHLGAKCLSGEYLHTRGIYAWEAAYHQTMQNVLSDLRGEDTDPDGNNWRRNGPPQIRRV